MNDIREEFTKARRFNERMDLTIRYGFYVTLGILGWVGVTCLR